MNLNILNRHTFSKLILALLFICLATTSNSAYAFDRMGSIGATLGYAHHSFELEGYEPVENSDLTYSIILGWDITDRISLEHSWFSFGDYDFRKLQPDGNDHVGTELTGFGLASLVYLAGSRGLDGIKTRRGLNLYAKFGISYVLGDVFFGTIKLLENVTDGERLNLGLGIEYSSSQTLFAIRGEVNAHNDDLIIGTLSLLWRWGRNR